MKLDTTAKGAGSHKALFRNMEKHLGQDDFIEDLSLRLFDAAKPGVGQGAFLNVDRSLSKSRQILQRIRLLGRLTDSSTAFTRSGMSG